MSHLSEETFLDLVRVGLAGDEGGEIVNVRVGILGMGNRAKAAVQQLAGRIPRDFGEPGVSPEEPALEIDFSDPREGAFMRRTQALLAFTQRRFRFFQVSDIDREAAGVDELPFAKMYIGAYQHVLDRAVLRLEPRCILVEFFAPRQAARVT